MTSELPTPLRGGVAVGRGGVYHIFLPYHPLTEDCSMKTQSPPQRRGVGSSLSVRGGFEENGGG